MSLAKARKILSLKSKFTKSDLRKSRNKLALMYHTNKNPQGGDKFFQIQRAYEVLTKFLNEGGNVKEAEEAGKDEGAEEQETAIQAYNDEQTASKAEEEEQEAAIQAYNDEQAASKAEEEEQEAEEEEQEAGKDEGVEKGSHNIGEMGGEGHVVTSHSPNNGNPNNRSETFSWVLISGVIISGTAALLAIL